MLSVFCLISTMVLWNVGLRSCNGLITLQGIHSRLRTTLRRPRFHTPSPRDKVDEDAADRPFSLPPGEFRPKQSLGQNFLSDQNYVLKIVDSFQDDSPEGSKVIEIGPGAGALSRVLYTRYPKMTAIELDQRAVAFLAEKIPGLNVIRMDVLEVDWPKSAVERGGPISVIANLPYYIVSQVLFCLADSHKAVNKAVVTMQLEVVISTHFEEFDIHLFLRTRRSLLLIVVAVCQLHFQSY